MKLLAIDYGLATIGLAFAQTRLAEPYGQISNTSDEESASKIAALCLKENIEKVVVGISEGKMAERTKDFTSLLKDKLTIPVVLSDETLSSYTAKKYLIQSGVKQKKRKTREHEVAAAIILQTYLDEHEDDLL